MKNLVKTVLVAFVALCATPFAVAQEVEAAKPQREPGQRQRADQGFKMNLTEQVSIYNFDSGTITQWDTKLDFKLDNDVKVDITLPVFNDDSQVNSTGVGDVNVNLTYDNAVQFLGFSVDIFGGVGVPLDGDYSSSDCTFSGGAELSATWEAVDFTQSVKYTLVNDYTYMPVFGGFVEDNVFALESTLKYNVSEKFGVCGNFDQFYTDGQNVITVGPSVTYNFAHNIAFNAGVAFAVSADLDVEDMDTVTTFGLGFKF
jgi:hypothetical protein